MYFLSDYLFYLNSVDPDKMSHCAAFHPGLHCKSNGLGVSFIQRVYSPLAEKCIRIWMTVFKMFI